MVMDYNVMTETSTVTYNTKHRLQFNENGFKMSISINTVEREVKEPVKRVDMV